MIVRPQLTVCQIYLMIAIGITCFSSTAKQVNTNVHLICFDSMANTLWQKVSYTKDFTVAEQMVALPLNTDIRSLLILSNEQPHRAQHILPNMNQNQHTFNVAEKFLLRVIQANIADQLGQEQQAMMSLQQASMMESQLPSSQLYTPDFNQSKLLLSAQYAKIGQFKQAFDAQALYLKRRYFHQLGLTAQRLTQLNSKYDVDIKIKENQLLQSQLEYKGLQLAKVQARNIDQQINIIILITILAGMLILVYRQLHIRYALAKLAKIDTMTGLCNRDRLFKQGRKLVASATTMQSALSIIVFDIDNLKRVNDSYGHTVGDEMIRSIAVLGTETMRSRDVIARTTGGQFAAILPGTNLEEAKAFAERFREKVELCDLHHANINNAITISAGIANSKEFNACGFEVLFDSAEQAMQIAKTTGKNRVCSFNQQN